MSTPNLDFIDDLPEEDLRKLYDLAMALDARERANPLDFFTPYPKQNEFFSLGATKRERLFQAGTQVGKSKAGAYELACHLTGNYPSWWIGKKFTQPVRAWACGESGTAVRDSAFTHLFGNPFDVEASGLIAKHLIVGEPNASKLATGLHDIVRIRHISGGVSTLSPRVYTQEREVWQSVTLELLWFDEEAPEHLYAEGLARLTGDGISFTTFTPLKGRTSLVDRFYHDENSKALADRGVVRMSLDDAAHFSAKEKEQRLAGYLAHERDARRYGEPMMGEGAVFTTHPDQIRIDSTIAIPPEYYKLWGIDFGVTHPFAATLLAHDRERDIVYVVACIRMSSAKPIEHCAAMNRIAPDVRVAWPHDMSKRESSVESIHVLYRREGLKLLPSHAVWPDNSMSLERDVMEMESRLSDGRLRVLGHLADWFEEYRGWHRKAGKIVAERDDIIAATRYGLRQLRSARPGAIVGGYSNYRPSWQNKPVSRTAANTNFDVFGINSPSTPRGAFTFRYNH